jgi:hypothetical protein
MWQSWSNMVIGLWMIFSGIVATLSASGNFIVTGILLAILGFWSRGWKGTLIGLIGLWAIFSGFVPGLIVPANMIITGAVVTVLAIWKASAMTARPQEPTTVPH